MLAGEKVAGEMMAGERGEAVARSREGAYLLHLVVEATAAVVREAAMAMEARVVGSEEAMTVAASAAAASARARRSFRRRVWASNVWRSAALRIWRAAMASRRGTAPAQKECHDRMLLVLDRLFLRLSRLININGDKTTHPYIKNA